MKFVIATVAALAAGVSAGAVDLTADNFDELTKGKGSFVKFFAPWCGHCKKLKPAWDKLGDAFADSKTVLIGDVDCTVHQGLCGEYGVKGYPTVKYFADGDWQDYSGGREYDDLVEFANSSLGPSCSYPERAELCSEEQLTQMKEWAAKPDELKAEIAKLEAEVKKLNDDFDDALKELQENYKNLMSTRDDGVKAAKKPLGLLKSITV